MAAVLMGGEGCYHPFPMPQQAPSGASGPRRWIVFTDLDGTLLDHEDYSWQAARPALEYLKAHRVPVIPVTSKTRSEVEELRRELGLEDPFVVENGGGVFVPTASGLELDGADRGAPEQRDGYRVLILGAEYPVLRRFVEELPEAWAVRGFGDMSLEEIRELTGLGRAAAERARRREFTEPLVVPEERLEALEETVRRAGLRLTRGGRFHHLMGEGQDKGEAVRCLILAYRRRLESRRSAEELATLGLGDSWNDLGMLEAVDVPVLVPNPRGTPVELERPDLRRAPAPGPAGWSAAVLDLVHDGLVRDGG